MVAMEWPHILAVALGVSVFVLLVLIHRLQQSQKNLVKRLDALECVLKNTRIKYEQLSSHVNGHRAGVNELMQRQQKLEALCESKMVQTQERETHRGGEGKLYQRANRMVALGASLEELMSECDLPRAEAELFLSLQKHKTIG